MFLCEAPYTVILYVQLIRVCCILHNSFLSGQNGCHSVDDIFRCIFVNEQFVIVKKIRFHCSLSLTSSWQYRSISINNGFMPNRWQAIIWTNAGMIHWRIFVALVGEEIIDSVISNILKTVYTIWFTWVLMFCIWDETFVSVCCKKAK